MSSWSTASPAITRSKRAEDVPRLGERDARALSDRWMFCRSEDPPEWVVVDWVNSGPQHRSIGNVDSSSRLTAVRRLCGHSAGETDRRGQPIDAGNERSGFAFGV